MKLLTEAEFNEMIAAKLQCEDRAKVLAQLSTEDLARIVVQEAAPRGEVLTIEQRPLKPLAMGHYETVISVRPARKQGGGAC